MVVTSLYIHIQRGVWKWRAASRWSWEWESPRKSETVWFLPSWLCFAKNNETESEIRGLWIHSSSHWVPFYAEAAYTRADSWKCAEFNLISFSFDSRCLQELCGSVTNIFIFSAAGRTHRRNRVFSLNTGLQYKIKLNVPRVITPNTMGIQRRSLFSL